MNILGLFFTEKKQHATILYRKKQSYKEISNKLHIDNGCLTPTKYRFLL